MTRVLHVLEALEGGTARHVSDLVRHLPEVDHHVAVPSRRVGGATDHRARLRIVASGGQLHTVEMRRMPHHPNNGLALARLARLVGRLRPDVVHGHSSVGGALARLVAGRRGARAFYTPNGLHPSAGAAGLERLFGPLTDRFIAVSEGEARVAAVRALVAEERLVVVRNGVDLSGRPEPGAPLGATPPDLRRRLGLGADTRLVGFVGRMVGQKAPEVMVDAAEALVREVPGVHVVLIGSGRDDAMVEDRIARHGLVERVHRIPHVPGAAEVMDQLEAFALPSRFEGCPYAPLEAMRAGVPVVLTEVVGNREVVDHGESGLLTPVDDPHSLASALALLLTDESLRRRLVAGARSRLAERFDVARNTARVGLLYEEAARS